MVKILGLITGRSGSGKSAELKEILLQKIKDGNQKTILLVPEQSSFENEKNMLKILGNDNFGKIHVLSFSRLYDFVSHTLKIPPINPVNETDKIILMNAAIESVRHELKLYGDNLYSSDLALTMLDIIKEFKCNKITTKELEKIQTETSRLTLKQKAKEMKLIFESHKALTQDKFKDSLDALNILENIIKNHRIFEGYNIFIDEFNDFTIQQMSILEILLLQSDNLYITLCCEKINNRTPDSGLFDCVNQTAQKLRKFALKNSIPIEEISAIPHTEKFKNSELKNLEKNVFESKKQSFTGTPDNINLYGALDINEECERVAQIIRQLVVEKNCRYRDFTILMRNAENYSCVFKSVFKKYDIPYFIDAPEKILNKNLTNLIFAAFDAVHSHYDTSEILKFIKSGLIGLNPEEISLIENYVLLWEINGQKWKKDFTMHPEGFSRDFTVEDVSKLNEINRIRKIVILPLEQFEKSISGTTGKGISSAVYTLLMRIKADENLRNFCIKLSSLEETNAAEKQARLWDTVMDILSKTSQILGDKKISSEKYRNIFMSSVNSVDCSSIPQSVDNVVIGCVNRTRVCAPKTVFIVGAVNGEFPLVPAESEIFTESEITHIASMGIKLRENTENLLIKERFLAYTALSSASEKLYVSWPAYAPGGKVNLPSEIIKEIKSIFPDIKILNGKSANDEDSLWHEHYAFQWCSQNWKNSSSNVQTLKKYFIENEKYLDKCMALENLLDENSLNFKNSKISENLFGKNIKLSASQIEKYHTCRFGYFCEYALEAKPQKPLNFSASEYGSLVHYVLEKLFKKYPPHILDKIKENLGKEIDTLINDYVNKHLGGGNDKSGRFSYTLSRFKESLIFLINHFTKESVQSRFEISDLELNIKHGGDIEPLEILLDNGTKIEIEGKIDRVDVMKTENGNYIRIIDYKTGTKEFKLSDVLYGLNAQMLIYLMAIRKNGAPKYGKIIPSGVLYFTAVKPIIESESAEIDTGFEEKIQKKLRMNGLVLNDPEIILGMEKKARGMFIPAVLKNGEIKKSESLADINDLNIVSKYTEHLIKKMVLGLQNGQISAKPIQKTHTACRWCEYFPICRYEKEEFINIPPSILNKTVIEKMRKESGCKDE